MLGGAAGGPFVILKYLRILRSWLLFYDVIATVWTTVDGAGMVEVVWLSAPARTSTP